MTTEQQAAVTQADIDRAKTIRGFDVETFARVLAAHRLASQADQGEAMGNIDRLRDDEGDSVTILCDNPGDFDMSYNVAIDCNGGWTGWIDRRFTGQNVADCLRQAVEARAAVGEDYPEYVAACDIPPPGWKCSRESGHDGPCAATQPSQKDEGDE